MKNTHTRTVRLTMLVAALAIPSIVAAAESTNYRLYDEAPNYAEPGTKDSQSQNYRMREGGLTWFAVPLIGSTVHVNPAPMHKEETVMPSSTSSDGGGGEESGGGRRRSSVIDEQHPAASSSSSQQSVTSSSSSSAASVRIDVDPPFLPPPDAEPLRNANFPKDERLVTGIHYFMLVDESTDSSVGGEDDAQIPIIAGSIGGPLDCSACPGSSALAHAAAAPAAAAAGRSLLWILAVIEFLALVRLTLLYGERERELIPGFAFAGNRLWSSTDAYAAAYGRIFVSDHRNI